jgi:hypothetical protein
MNKRLELIRSMIRDGTGLIDVGTDHGYLPAALFESGYRGRLFASDINALPLAKAKETGELPAVDDTETITTTRVHAPKKSIIDEAQEFAAKRRETMEMQTKTGADVESSSVGATKAAFEDEHGVPENRILTSPFNGKTVLRPTARERITSAMQSLSDVLHHDRSKVSHPKEQTPPRPEVVATAVAHPLEMNRFDRESSVNSKILQMSRIGFPASAIASKLKIPQAKVEAVIKEAVEAGN